MDVSDRRQRIAILGSTGSIGRNTLDVISTHRDRFEAVALAASRNAGELERQAIEHNVRYVSLEHGHVALDGVTTIDIDPLTAMATLDEVDIVVIATTGHAAIEPTIAALNAGKVVALANKETIVAAGALVMPIARQRPGSLRPVDSEHSALWQCLGGRAENIGNVQKLILTASGGPFRGFSIDQLKGVTPEDALRHPTWDMGAKVTIDSATLMNKGLEVIEAHWLFDMPFAQVEVVVHPQSLVHSLVEFVDGSVLAQIGSHDMRLPIQYALSWPDRLGPPAPPIDILALSRLDFEAPDTDSFPLLRLAYAAGEADSTYPAVLSAADSVAVSAFLDRRIGFADIASIVSTILDAHNPDHGTIAIETILEADRWATAGAMELVDRIGRR